MSDDNKTSDDKTIFMGAVDAQVSTSDKTVFIGEQKPIAGTSEAITTIAVLKHRFELKELLGAGGMGAVYRAVDQRKVEANDRDPNVAIKVLNSDFQQHPQAFISLQREARKSQQLAHPNIVTVYDFDRDGDMVFMTMEYMEGEPLDELLKKEQGIGVGLEVGCKILRSISEALICAHNNHIVHADFKPGNIFVTTDGVSKVFDFGIARAVSSQGVLNGTGVTTLFDAATLGALTPAYASYEMLVGMEPSTVDDLYALACVAYELFSGVHPFNKLPADKAREAKLKPARIKSLSRRQWRALSKALSFERDQRTGSVDQFSREFFSTRSGWRAGIAAVVVVAVAAGVYQSVVTVDTELLRSDIEADVTHKFEQKLAQESAKEELQELVAAEELTEDWDRRLERQLKIYQDVLPDDTATPLTVRAGLVTLYLNTANDLMERGELKQVDDYLTRAESWGATVLAQAARDKLTVRRQDELRHIDEIKRSAEHEIALAKKKKISEDKQFQQRREERKVAEQQQRQRDRLANVTVAVDNALRCQTLDIKGQLATAIEKLIAVSPSVYEQRRGDYANAVIKCVRVKERTSAERANQWLRESRQLFSQNTQLLAMNIDNCLHLKAGSGGRSNRMVCRDSLGIGAKGPAMVVVAKGVKRYAIGKYELSNKEFNLFCRQTGCRQRAENARPVTEVSIAQVQKYLAWLSIESGFSYSLPDYDNWLLAARGKSEVEDPDRNCYLKYGGIHKGFELISSDIGRKNSNGLVNVVGNARELTLHGRELWAAGGSRKDPMSKCLVSTKYNHTGSADALTGFRVMRTI